jgi:hypothetical protein
MIQILGCASKRRPACSSARNLRRTEEAANKSHPAKPPEQPHHTEATFAESSARAENAQLWTRKTKGENMSLHSSGMSRRIPISTIREANFLEDQLPLSAFATLTLTRRASKNELDFLFTRWTTGIQAENRLTVAWVAAQERGPQPHIHAVLIAHGKLDCIHAEALWRAQVATRYTEAAKVEPYVYGCDGLAYVLKSLDSPNEDVRFSSNLSAFAVSPSSQFYGRTGIERRQMRRIAGQAKRFLQ